MAPEGTVQSKAKAKAVGSKTSKRNLLDDSDSDSDDGGVQLDKGGFKVNEEYARRFEHNKKREEQHRCKLASINF